MTRKKTKMKQLKCQFIYDKVPDFRALANTRDLPEPFNKTVEPYKYARKVFLKDALNGEILFIVLKVKDQNKALEVLLHLLSCDIHCPVEALYQIYGNFDFLIELFGTSEQLNQAHQVIDNAETRIGVLSKDPHTISQKSRHWGFDLVNGGEPDPNSFTWLINAEKYKAIRAFVFCDAPFSTPSERDGFVKRLLVSLDYPLNGSQDSIKASQIIDRIYFDKNHRPILGVLCACGDYYHLNTLTNKIDALLEQEYNVKGKQTYVVAGTPHFSPHSSGLQVGFVNEWQELLEKGVAWLKNEDECNLNKYRVAVGYYRRPEVASELRLFVGKVKRQCAKSSRTPNNWLVQGKSGSGKTSIFKRIADELGGAVTFVRIALDAKGMDKTKWEKNLAEVAQEAKKKPVLCLLDEMNKYQDETWPLEKLRDYLENNEELEKSQNEGHPIVWVLAGSEGETIDDLKYCIAHDSKGEPRPNGLDIIKKRINHTMEIPIANQVDGVSRVCGTIRRLAGKIGFQCEYVEKRAILFLLRRSPKDAKKCIQDALKRMKDGQQNETMTYGYLFETEDQDRDKFLQEFPQVAEFADSTLLITGK